MVDDSGERERAVQQPAAREAPQETELPLICARGCGERVAKASSKHIVGHSMRRWGHSILSSGEVEAFVAQHCLTACAFCSWRFEGSVGEGHRAFLAHMAAQHSDVRRG